jgi:hypothetical protein
MRMSAERLSAILRDNWLFLLVVGAIVIAFLVLRTPGTRVESLAEVDTLLRSGQPALVEFYSNT